MLRKHPLLQMLIAVASLASIGIFIHKSELEPIATGFYRCLFGLPFLLLINRINKKNLVLLPKISASKFHIVTLVAGICLGMDMLVWNMSFKYTTMAETNLIVNITPLLIFPITVFYFKEKFSYWVIAPFSLAAFGLYLLVFATTKNASASLHITGDILSFIAAIFYSIFVVLTKYLADKATDMGKYMVYVIAYCAVLLLIGGIYKGNNFVAHDAYGWGLMVGLAFISIVCGQFFLAQSMKRLPLQLSSSLLLLQPVFAALYGLVLFNEELSTDQTIGAVLVLFAVYMFKRIEQINNK